MTTLVILFLAFPTVATQKRDSIVVSLLTAWPGPEVYQLCGHSAIRIRGAEVDSVWNYGVFDFDEPNFVYRFVKGETDYMLVGYPTMWFMPEYLSEGRKVLEQDLNLTQDEAWKLRSLLQTEALPQNRTYRYNYVKDNCATRITDRLAQATDARLIFPDTIAYGTFRREMRTFHRDYPWYQFGIDLALGSGLDREISLRERTYSPLYLRHALENASYTDSLGNVRHLVRSTATVIPGQKVTEAPTPWFLTPVFISLLILLLTALIVARDIRRRKITRWYDCVFYSAALIPGLLLTFLIFVSSHEATSPNWLYLWLNPFCAIPAVFIWIKSCRRVVYCYQICNFVALFLLLLIGIRYTPVSQIFGYQQP